jgi:Bacterial Ig-like domain
MFGYRQSSFWQMIIFGLAVVLLSACNKSQPPLKVTLNSSQSFASGALTLTVAIDGGVASDVELLKNGQAFKTLKTPFTYTWDTSKEAEGKYTFQARVVQQKTFVSKKVLVTVDHTVPAINQSLPLETDINIRYSDPIKIVFSEAVDVATINSSNVVLTSAGKTIENAAALSDDGRTLSIIPKAGAVTFPATLVLNLKNIKDLAGNPLEDKTWTWELPYWINLKGSLNQDAARSVESWQVAFDSKNNPVVLFAEYNTTKLAPTRVYVKRWTGSDWQLIGGQINSKLGYAEAGLIILDPNDNPIIAYSEYPAISDVRYGRNKSAHIAQWTGSAWQEITTVMPEPDYPYFQPQLYLKANGEHILSSKDSDKVTIKRWQNGKWNVEKIVSFDFPPDPIGYISFVRVTLDADNNPFVMWIDSSTAYKGMFTKHWNGKTWDLFGNKPLNTGTEKYINSMSLMPDKSNNPIVVWTETSVSSDVYSYQLYMKRWESGAWKWLDNSGINLDKSMIAAPLTVSFDLQQRPVLSWYEFEVNKTVQTYAKIWLNGEWQLLGGESLALNPKHDATGMVVFNTLGVPFLTLIERIDGIIQLFVREANH